MNGPSSRKFTETLGSMGSPLSSVRHRPSGSKFSCMKPKGLMTWWQAGHAPVWVTLSTFWRSVPVAVAGIAVLTPAGGWPSGMHITLRVKNTPRFTRRVVSGPECEVITPEA